MLHFTNIPPGTYAVSVFHDENDHGRLTADAAGIPSEGYGFSRNAIGRRGPPKFDDAAITVRDGDTTIDLDLVY